MGVRMNSKIGNATLRQATAVALLALAGIVCDSQISSADTLRPLTLLAQAGTARPVTAAAPAPKLEESMVFAGLGGTVQNGLQKCAIDGFQKKYNVRVEYLPAQPSQTLAKVVAQRTRPTIDVMWSSNAEAYRGFKAGVFVPITPKLVPNLANIDPKFKPQPNTGAMIGTGLYGIGYNAKVFKEKGWAPPVAWKDLWDPKFKGHVGIYSITVPVGQGTLAAAALINGGSVANIDPGFASLAKLKPNLYTIFTTAPQFDTAFLDEHVWIGAVNAARMVDQKHLGNPIDFIQPEEGVVASNIHLEIIKDAPHPAAAAAFVDWMLSKEVQSCMPTEVGYSPVVGGISVPRNLEVYYSAKGKVLPIDWDGMQERLADWLKRWNKEIEG